MKKKTILVTGATGAQGGSVARALLKKKKYHVRILTRNPTGEKAIALERAGAQIVKGDMENQDTLVKAMEGCYGVFGVTNFWEHFEKEFDHGKNLVDAAHLSGVRHLVFSTQPDYHQLSKGRYCIPHYDVKATIERYAKRLSIPSTFVHLSFYYENFFRFVPIQPVGDGSYYFGLPQENTPLAMVSVEDLGGIVSTIFDYPVEYTGRTVGVVGDIKTGDEYASILSGVLQQKISYRNIPAEAYAKSGLPGAKEIAEMFEAQRKYPSDRQIEMIESYGLNPFMTDFNNWVKKNRWKFNFYFEATREIRVA